MQRSDRMGLASSLSSNLQSPAQDTGQTDLMRAFTRNEDCIIFNGHIPLKDINFKNFDLFVFASLNEGSPNAVIESITNNINSNQIGFTIS